MELLNGLKPNRPRGDSLPSGAHNFSKLTVKSINTDFWLASAISPSPPSTPPDIAVLPPTKSFFSLRFFLPPPFYFLLLSIFSLLLSCFIRQVDIHLPTTKRHS
eukprot:GHVS01023069.1.p1 GENE.GHVS01023069.1~~GHVS01023069.1.p1  ORF type:complete len:104 (-),score=25.40 GHVS01023069.1:223-534(-)